MKKTMQVWQLIALCVLLAAVVVSMAFPVVSTSGERTWEKLDALDSKYKDNKDFSEGLKNRLESAAEKKKKGEKDYAKRFDDMLQETDMESSLNGMDIISGKAISKTVQESLDEINEIKEKDRSDTAKQYVVLAGQYKKLRLVLGVLYFLPLLLILLLVLSFALKWDKKISILPISIVSLLGTVVYGGGFFTFSNFMNKKILVGPDYEEFSFVPKLSAEKYSDTILQTSKTIWDSFRGNGLLITGIIFALILGISIVVLVMNQNEMLSDMTYGAGIDNVMPVAPEMPGGFGDIPTFPGGNNNQAAADVFKEQNFFEPVKPVTKEKPMGRVVCIEGIAKGKGCKFPEENKVLVGANPAKCSIVIASQYVSGVHFSVRYSAATNTYTVKDHSSNGSFVNGVRLQNGIPMAYPAGTIIVLADGSNKIKLG